MNKKAIRQIVRWAELKGLNPIEEVQDYLAEKDSYPSRRQVQLIIAEIMNEEKKP